MKYPTLLAGLALAVTVGSCGPDQRESPPAPAQQEDAFPPPSADERIADAVGSVKPSADFERFARLAVVAEYPNPDAAKLQSIKSFEFDGGPTACGYVIPAPGEPRQRFIYRNGNAVVEQNHRPAVFDEFWRFCEAGGVD